jgi:hypothetical protein
VGQFWGTKIHQKNFLHPSGEKKKKKKLGTEKKGGNGSSINSVRKTFSHSSTKKKLSKNFLYPSWGKKKECTKSAISQGYKINFLHPS